MRSIVKSKSMASEEIHLNQALEQAGLEVVETDLGEYIIQLAGETPSHIIAPAIHKTREQVASLFEQHLHMPPTNEVPPMIRAARQALRQRFLRADMGISGVNFGVAEEGAIVIVENEGNARFTITAPRIHVAIMGIERIVATLDDLGVMLQVLARSATGQKLNVYTNIICGPARPGEADGPEEFHLVLLDNGRSTILGGPYAEALMCIRCGACLNACPVYQQIGGHAYGGVYSGPIGAVLTPAPARPARQPPAASRLVPLRCLPGGLSGAYRPARSPAAATRRCREGGQVPSRGEDADPELHGSHEQSCPLPCRRPHSADRCTPPRAQRAHPSSAAAAAPMDETP